MKRILLNIETNIELNVEPNIGSNIKPNIESNIEPIIEPNIEPNIELIIEPNIELGHMHIALCSARRSDWFFSFPGVVEDVLCRSSVTS